MAAQADARKAPIAGLAALAVLEGVDDVYVVKGTKTLLVGFDAATYAKVLR